MKKNLVLLLVNIILIFTLAACSVSQLAVTTASGVGQTASAAAATTSGQSAAAASAQTANTSANAAAAATASADNSPTHEDASDYVYDAAAAISIQLNGNSITASGEGVTVDGSKATITAPGTYSLSGSLADGQIIVNSQVKGVVRLVLNGVDIHSSNSAPIYVMDAGKAVIVLAENSQNTLTDGASYLFTVQAEEEPGAAIFSKSDLTIYGSGALTVNANFRDGINSKDGLIIASGNITVNAADDGLRGKDYLVVKDGRLTVNAKGDGLKADNDTDATMGYITAAAGTVQVNAGGDAINAQTDVLIQGGIFNLTSGGGSSQRADETTSAKGIKGGVSVVIDAGTFSIDAADDTIHTNGSITINNGTFKLAAADDGLHADETLTLNGGDLQITKSYEGIESAVITINDGSVHLTASDDGVNVAAGVDGSGAAAGGRPQQGGGPGQDAFTNYTGKNYLYIHGGYLFVDANGDGIDVNGAIEMTDGVVVVNGPTEQMNAAVDYDAGFKMTGGYIVAAGSSGMAQTASQTSSQPAALIYLTAMQPAGTLIHIQDSAGKDILTFAPTKSYQSVAFSSPELAQGATYTVFTGGSATGSAKDGLYEGGNYSAGTQFANFNTASIVTTVGTGGRMGPGGRRP